LKSNVPNLVNSLNDVDLSSYDPRRDDWKKGDIYQRRTLFLDMRIETLQTQ
jgi:hypothetical protein